MVDKRLEEIEQNAYIGLDMYGSKEAIVSKEDFDYLITLAKRSIHLEKSLSNAARIYMKKIKLKFDKIA